MSATTYFDTRHSAMQRTTETEGCRALCYDRQAGLVESLIRPGMAVLDIGCGPSLPYRTPHAYVIGLDPSAESLATNTDVDDRIVGSATSIPLPDASVDVVVAFYAIHHMTGRTTYESDQTRRRAVAEMVRVVRPGGSLLVFEMAPWAPAAAAQDILWNQAKDVLGDRLDAYFWTDDQFAWTGIPFERTAFRARWHALVPPVCSLPWLRIPRFLYPFTPTLYRWTQGA